MMDEEDMNEEDGLCHEMKLHSEVGPIRNPRKKRQGSGLHPQCSRASCYTIS